MGRYLRLYALSMVISVCTAMPAFAEDPAMLVRVMVESPSDSMLLSAMDLDITSAKRGIYVDIVATEDRLRVLKDIGFRASVLNEDLRGYFKEKINMDGQLGAYHTYGEMLTEMKAIASAYPSITRLIDIGDSWEKANSIADRDIWAMKITDMPDETELEEPAVLIVGNHHAREIITVEVPLAVIRALTEGYAKDWRIKRLVDSREIWVVPMMNPDGHNYVATADSLWRKNRNTNGYSNPYYQGVDLNRNYSYKWAYDDIGSSPFEDSSVYRGTAPFSEPETQAIKNLMEHRAFILSISYHSYGDLFLFPWGYIDADTADHDSFDILGRIYTKKNGYRYGNAKDGIIYNTNGEMCDWVYGETFAKPRGFAVTVEVGDAFQPPEDTIDDLIM
ncbi:MAG: zinc carboxypeptidase, partial [Deltaproteobacteria bacterium]|nr:zinc carboxypeptidase [Deltaproteobacteria bacterium]